MSNIQPTPQDIADQISELKGAIRYMDYTAQNAFKRIDVLAALALQALEAPSGHASVFHLARAFESIRDIVGDAENAIGHEAEKSGDGYEDEAWARRMSAHLSHQKTGGNKP